MPAARVRPAWGGDGRSCGCGRRGQGGLPGPGGHRAQCPRGKGLSLGTGTRPLWGPLTMRGVGSGLRRSRSCLCPSLEEGVEGCGAVSLGWDPCTGEWASPGRVGPQQQPHGADGATRKGRIRGTCPDLLPAPRMGDRWHPGTLGGLVWRVAGALGAPGSAPRGVGAASQPSRPLDTPLPPHRGAPAGTPCGLMPWPRSAPVAGRTPGAPVRPAA